MQCVMCTAPLSGKQKKFCSPRCSIDGYAQRRHDDGRIAQQRERHKEKREAYFKVYRQTYQHPREVRTCAGCGETFECRRGEKSKAGPQRYCSAFCGQLFREPGTWSRGPRPQSRRTLATKKATRAARGTQGRSIWFAGSCIRCDEPFITRRTRDFPKYCSDRCKLRDVASRRRAREVGARVETIYRRRVFERDNWVCHICGDSIRRDAKPNDLDYPTLDHVIPLARGGAHSMANLKPAHLWCNSVKRDVDLALIH